MKESMRSVIAGFGGEAITVSSWQAAE